jgi:hypothetical protein
VLATTPPAGRSISVVGWDPNTIAYARVNVFLSSSTDAFFAVKDAF